jgi:Tfp pilus assembly protein FimT
MGMRRHWNAKRVETGYSIIELALVLTIVGGLTALATPFFLRYYQASKLRVAAEEVVAFVNQGRQLAILNNCTVRVHSSSAALQYFLGNTCGTPGVWIGAGTDAAGNIYVPHDIALSETDSVFSYLGAASGAEITVTNLQTGTTVSVCIALSGRVSIRSACS